MFPDAFAPQLAAFALLAAAGLSNMRLGRFPFGFAQFALAWLLADLALALAFLLEAPPWALPAVLALLQLAAVAAAAGAVVGLVRRASRRFQESEDELYRAALVAYVQGRDEEAWRVLRRLRRREPWNDVVAELAAEVAARTGRRRRARALRRAARRLAAAREAA